LRLAVLIKKNQRRKFIEWRRVREQRTTLPLNIECAWPRGEFLSRMREREKQKRIPFLKNEPEKLLKIKAKATWVAKNEPESEAEKLLKTRTRGKSKPETNRKTNLPDVVQNNRR